MSHSASVRKFDFVALSSSPVMVIRAIQLAQDGCSVALVDDQQEWGGAWRVKSDPRLGRIEVACHLIENMPGVYPLLASMSGVPFTPLQPQPVRISKRGRKVAYSSRAEIGGQFLRYCLMLTIKASEVLGRKILPRGPWRRKLVKTSWPGILLRLQEHWKYRMPRVIHGTEIWGPEGGCARFMDGLKSRAEREGVEFYCGRVKGAESCDSPPGWVLYCDKGLALVEARHLILSESVRVNLVSGDAKLQLNPPTEKYWHMALAVRSDSAFNVPPYIHLRHNLQIHRITHLATCGAGSPPLRFFLVQLRDPETSMDCVVQELSQALGVEPGAKLSVEQYFELESSEHVPVSNPDVRSLMEDFESVTMLRTIGDLARCVAATEEDLARMQQIARPLT